MDGYLGRYKCVFQEEKTNLKDFAGEKGDDVDGNPWLGGFLASWLL